MGVETAIIIGGLTLAKGVSDYNQGKSNARATANEGKIAMENRKKEIQRLAAKQKIGYLQSGVELEGTASSVIQDTYNTGIEDINAIASATNKSIKNQLTTARANLLGSVAMAAVQGYSMYSMGGGTSLTGNATQGAMSSGGEFMSANNGLNHFNLTGTASSGGNVTMRNAIYTGV